MYKRHLVSFFAAALGLCLGLSVGGAPLQDSAEVNADLTRVRVDNERVRVLETTLPPGAREALHAHPAHVIYVVAGGKMRNHAADGTFVDAEAETGAVLYREATIHATENIGDETLRVVLVELKGSD